MVQGVLRSEEDIGFTALLGGGDLADLTNGKDKRDTVGFRGGGFLDEESSSLSDDPPKAERDSMSLESISDES